MREHTHAHTQFLAENTLQIAAVSAAAAEDPMLGQSMRCFKRGGERGSLVVEILRDSSLQRDSSLNSAGAHERRVKV